MAEIIYHLPDFEDEDGIRYSEIEVVIRTDDICDVAKLARTLGAPTKTKPPKR